MGTLRTTRMPMGLVVLFLVPLLVQGADAQRREDDAQDASSGPPDAAVPADNPYGQQGSGEAAEDTSASGADSEPADAEPAPDEGASEGSLDELFAGPDLGPLREEFTAIMDELVQTRSRMAVLGRQLFRTRMRIQVHNQAGDEQALARLTIELDGAPVFKDEGQLGEEARQVFEGFAAPGPHLVTVHAEQHSRGSAEYRYTLRDTYRLEVLRGKLTEILVVLEDDSDIAEDFPDDEEGEYDVRTRVRVATRELDAR